MDAEPVGQGKQGGERGVGLARFDLCQQAAADPDSNRSVIERPLAGRPQVSHRCGQDGGDALINAPYCTLSDSTLSVPA